MEGEIDPTAVLDYVSFQISSCQNRFEAHICSNGVTESVASGQLDQLELHLPSLNGSNCDSTYSFRLHIDEGMRDYSSWFIKSTVLRFLLAVNEPDLLKSTMPIQNELNQLEDTKKFQLALYNKANHAYTEGQRVDADCLEGIHTRQEVMTGMTSEATKNELLRALDLRVKALKDQLVAIFTQAIGGNCSKIQLSNLTSFVEYFGANILRDAMLKYVSPRFQSCHTSEEPPSLPSNVKVDPQDRSAGENTSVCSQLQTQKFAQHGVSVANITEAEFRSSAENEESSNSGNIVRFRSYGERSRSAVRSASPRRSASPMRRIHIGKSSSRRSTGLSIKSLNHFSARNKTLLNSGTDGNSSEDKLPDEQSKRSENTIMRMSVQDRINLFESKQRDQILDSQKCNTSAEAFLCAKNSVSRKWNAGAQDPSPKHPQENKPNDVFETLVYLVTASPDEGSQENKSDVTNFNSIQADDIADVSSKEVENIESFTIDSPHKHIVSQTEAVRSKAEVSGECTRQKEAKLNQMLENMLQSKPSGHASRTSGSTTKNMSRNGKVEISNKYKKHDENLKVDNSRKSSEKGMKKKQMPDTVVLRKTEVASKSGGFAGSTGSSVQSHKARRNSSPQMIPKTSTTISASSTKALPRPSSNGPSGRNSWPSVPCPRTAGAQSTKTSRSRMMANNSTMNGKKLEQMQPPTQPEPQTERQKQPKGTKDAVLKYKGNLNSQEKKEKPALGSTRYMKKRTLATPVIGSNATLKPGFYQRATKKSTVVPLETKPFSTKDATNCSDGGTILMKAKTLESDASTTTMAEVQDNKDSLSDVVMTAIQSSNKNHTQSNDRVDIEHVNTVISPGKAMHISDPFVVENERSPTQMSDFPASDNLDDLEISSAAWIEVDYHEETSHYENELPRSAPVPASESEIVSSPCVQRSLSQMLQAEISVMESFGWGNAEIPPNMIYQKDSPKGLKRLLKFAKKNKEDSIINGRSMSSVSDGEVQMQELKGLHTGNMKALSRKEAPKAKASGLRRNVLSESYDAGKPGRGSVRHAGNYGFLSGSMDNFPSGFQKTQGHLQVTSASNKASRSFFSLSTFRSTRPSEGRPRQQMQ